MKFQTLYNRRVTKGFSFDTKEKPSKTRQDAKDECLIGNIIDRYKKTRTWYDPLGYGADCAPRMPMFEDISNIPDFDAAQQIVRDAAEKFNALPASVRDSFSNNPTLFFAFVADPANKKKCQEMGLLPLPIPVPAPEEPAIEKPTPEAEAEA